jgi:hypothetical protein
VPRQRIGHAYSSCRAALDDEGVPTCRPPSFRDVVRVAVWRELQEGVGRESAFCPKLDKTREREGDRLSFFAVLDVEDQDKRKRFTVERCHLNLWSLAGLGPRRRIFVLDVGLKIKASSVPVRGFSLALPFGVDTYSGLEDQVRTQTTAELIFDSTISYPGNGDAPREPVIRVGSDDMKILSVQVGQKKTARLSNESLTVWDFSFITPLPAGEIGYVRLRFPIVNLGRTWQWQKASWRKSGAILDLRLSDQRSTATLDGGSELRARALALEGVNVFAMVPAWLNGRAMHPELNYTRVLENDVWSSYLRRQAERGAKPMIVFAWKVNIPVTLDSPLRIYADFIMRRRTPVLLIAVVALVCSVAAIGLIFDLPVRQPVLDGLAWAQDLIAHAILWIAGAGLFGIFLKYAKFLGMLRKFSAKVFHHVEDRVFNVKKNN